MHNLVFSEKQIRFNLPSNKSFLVWLSHDVDRLHKTFYQALYYSYKNRTNHHLIRYFKRENPYWNINKILSLEDEYKVKSTFFFLNEHMKPKLFKFKTYPIALGRYNIHAPHIKEIIKKVYKNKWEVGLHGSYYSFTNKNLLEDEKKTLEEIIQGSVDGIRQHYLNLTIPETWRIHQSLGLKYDASYGSATEIGYLNNIYYPFRPFNDEFIVFPLNIMEKALFQKKKNLNQIWADALKIINQAHEKKTLLSILWHQRVFDELDFPGHVRIYRQIIEECLKRNAIFCTGKNIFNFVKY